MKKKVQKTPEIKRKRWSQITLSISGFSLLFVFLINLALEISKISLPIMEEIFLILITVLAISFFSEGGLRLKKSTIYDIFYSSYIAFILVVLTAVYWISYLNGIQSGIFRSLIIFTHVLVFLYTLLVMKHSDRVPFIVLSYIFTVIMTIILFAYIYWTLSIFGIGHLQFSDCSKENLELRSGNWFYFSSVTFYSLGYGDICPIEMPARLVSQIEVALGTLINTILIGFIFWRIRRSN